ncbi:hypothetical protein LP419_05095 [Massilia sp. H-1]|nr:hypothetical protein LP419_05095 [Massilia sp. H-1]
MSIRRRGAACALCRMERRVFENKGRWTVDALGCQFVWLDARLQLPAAPGRTPVSDARRRRRFGLLEHERAVLASALAVWRQFCNARQRALAFTLARIEIGTSGSSSEVLA